jgi:hypothetical protein
VLVVLSESPVIGLEQDSTCSRNSCLVLAEFSKSYKIGPVMNISRGWSQIKIHIRLTLIPMSGNLERQCGQVTFFRAIRCPTFTISSAAERS